MDGLSKQGVMQASVFSLGGDECSFAMLPTSTIHDLKHEVARDMEVPTECQRLLLEEYECRDADHLAQLQQRYALLTFTLMRRPAWQVVWLKRIAKECCYKSRSLSDWWDDLFGDSSDDEDFCFDLFGSCSSFNIKDLPSEAQTDFDVILAVVNKWPQAYKDVSPALQEHVQIATAVVCKNGLGLQQMSNEMRANREVVSAAVMQNGQALRYAAARLRTDRDVVDLAISQNGAALQFAAPMLRGDRRIVEQAMSKDFKAFRFASTELRNTKDFMLPIVMQDGSSALFLGPALCADREVMSVAVKSWGGALKCAAPDLQVDLRLRRIAAAKANCHFVNRPNVISLVDIRYSGFRSPSVSHGHAGCRFAWFARTRKPKARGKHTLEPSVSEAPSHQQLQHKQLQTLMTLPWHEMPKGQQQEMRTLQKRAGPMTSTSINPRSERFNSGHHQLQLVMQAVPERPRERRCSDYRRLQNLASLRQAWRENLVKHVIACDDEQQAAAVLRIAEHKAHQLARKNRRNARDRKRAARVQRPGWGKAFKFKDFSECWYDLGNAEDSDVS
jgi:hypothetical protein